MTPIVKAAARPWDAATLVPVCPRPGCNRVLSGVRRRAGRVYGRCVPCSTLTVFTEGGVSALPVAKGAKNG